MASRKILTVEYLQREHAFAITPPFYETIEDLQSRIESELKSSGFPRDSSLRIIDESGQPVVPRAIGGERFPIYASGSVNCWLGSRGWSDRHEISATVEPSFAVEFSLSYPFKTESSSAGASATSATSITSGSDSGDQITTFTENLFPSDNLTMTAIRLCGQLNSELKLLYGSDVYRPSELRFTLENGTKIDMFTLLKNQPSFLIHLMQNGGTKASVKITVVKYQQKKKEKEDDDVSAVSDEAGSIGSKSTSKVSTKVGPTIEAEFYQVFTKTLTGKTMTFDVCDQDLFIDVMCLIENKEGIPADQQRLIYRGTQRNWNLNLAAMGVTKEETLHLVLSLRGS